MRYVDTIDRKRLNGFIRDTFEASQRDPAVVTVFGEWSACMRAAGFAYRVPADAPADPAWALSKEATAPEIAVAEADVGCKRATGLIAVWSAAEEAAQLAVIAAHREDFDLFRRARDAELGAARKVVEERLAVGPGQSSLAGVMGRSRMRRPVAW